MGYCLTARRSRLDWSDMHVVLGKVDDMFQYGRPGEYSKFIRHWVKSYDGSTCSRGLENVRITLSCQERSSLTFVFRRRGRAKILSMKFKMYSKVAFASKAWDVNSNSSS